jgi:hypothetical protein
VKLRFALAVVLAAVLMSASFTMAGEQNDLVEGSGPDIIWIKKGMVLDIGNPGDADSLFASGGWVIYDEDMYKIWYTGGDGDNWRIMYATSPDGIAWTKFGVVVDLGDPGDLDDDYAAAPSVMKCADGTYKMWYTAQSTASYGWRILYAVSDDGINWRKHGLVLETPGRGVGHASVLVDDFGLYRMWYSEYDLTNWRIMHAISSDGVSWEKRGIALDIGPPGAYDSRHVYISSVMIEPDGTYVMYYSAAHDNPHNNVDSFYATSDNGYESTWTKEGLLLAHGEAGDYDEVQAIGPKIVLMPDGLHMLFYSGYDGQNGRIMLAVEKVMEIEATLDCGPHTLNLGSMGNWITCYIELPTGYDPREIDATTIRLNEIMPPELDPKYDFVIEEASYITDHDADGIEERMVKFDRSDLQDILEVGSLIDLMINGQMTDEVKFVGGYVIRVIDPPEVSRISGFRGALMSSFFSRPCPR